MRSHTIAPASILALAVVLQAAGVARAELATIVAPDDVLERLSLSAAEVQVPVFATPGEGDADVVVELVLDGQPVTLELRAHAMRAADFQVLLQVDGSPDAGEAGAYDHDVEVGHGLLAAGDRIL